MTGFREALRRWVRNERGAFAVYAALVFPIFFALIGFGLDYWSTLSTKSRLDAAADDAALAGVRAATAFVQASGGTLSGTALTDAAIAAGKTAALQAFNANAGPSQSLTGVTPTITLSYANRTFTGTASYAISRPTGFTAFLGLNSLSVSGTATAAQKQLTYINVYVLVDTSQSMGIATNQTQMNALFNASAAYNPDPDYGPGVGCVFGCHISQNTYPSMEAIAHANSIELRIDTARAAVYQMAQTAQSTAVNGNIKFAIYSMQLNPLNKTYFSQVYPTSGLTNDYTKLQTAMGPTSYVLDLGSNTSQGFGDSDQPNSLSKFAATLPSSGDGSSASSPINYVYVITDGAIDRPSSCSDYNHCNGAVPASACDPVKAKGATVGVIYTTYIPIYAKNNPANGLDDRYSYLIDPIVGYFRGNLQSCATSSSWFYEAADGSALLGAANNLFANTLSVLRITN